MGNALTGDLDAVLQVNRTVLQRLVANIHANGDGANPEQPGLPHDMAYLVNRDGKPGYLTAQIGVPMVRFIDGASDRFRLAIDVRALFTPSNPDGEAYLPTFIHGKVRAEYAFVPVPPGTPGWSEVADALQPVVDRSTIRWEGRAHSGAEGPFFEPPDADARIHALLVDILDGGLVATPHRLGDTFRPDKLVTRVSGRREAVSIALLGDGLPSSVPGVFHEDKDLAIAISQEALLAPVQRALDDVRATFRARIETSVTILWGLASFELIAWQLSISEATVRYLGPQSGGGGAVEVRVTVVGDANRPGFDWAATVTQVVHVALDGDGSVRVSVVADPVIDVAYHGPEPDRVRTVILDQARAHIRPKIVEVANGTTVDLGLARMARELASQLSRLDPSAVVDLTYSRFTADGVVLFGRVDLAPWKPVVLEHQVDLPGYTAIGSWVPGGRIDSFTWSWDPTTAPTPEPVTHADRFVVWPRIVDPVEGSIFGHGFGSFEAMPGVGSETGRIFLTVAITRIHDETGEEYTYVESDAPVDVELPSWVTEDVVPTGMTVRGVSSGPGLVRLIVTGLGEMLGHGFGIIDDLPANTLVLRPGPGESIASLAATLGDALTRVTREGAGLRLILLTPPGTDLAWHEGAARSLREHVGRLVPFAVWEDVEGALSGSLGLARSDDAAWTALVSPHGGVPWAQDGVAEAEVLATALDTFLAPSGPPRGRRLGQAIAPGTQLTPWDLARAGDGAPPPPIGRDGRPTVLTFVRPDASGAQDAVVEQVRPRLAPTVGDALVAVVANGPEAGAVRATNLEPDDAVVVDPDGEVAGRLGISIWPTTVVVDAGGTVVRVITGTAALEEEVPS